MTLAVRYHSGQATNSHHQTYEALRIFTLTPITYYNFKIDPKCTFPNMEV